MDCSGGASNLGMLSCRLTQLRHSLSLDNPRAMWGRLHAAQCSEWYHVMQWCRLCTCELVIQRNVPRWPVSTRRHAVETSEDAALAAMQVPQHAAPPPQKSIYVYSRLLNSLTSAL